MRNYPLNFSIIFIYVLCYLDYHVVISNPVSRTKNTGWEKPRIEQETSNNKSMKIIAGENAQPGEIPSQISIQRVGIHFCGGSLIDEKFVLTAAHCVTGITDEEIENDDVNILAGDHFLFDSGAKTRAVRGIAKIFKHPDYDFEKTGFLNDVAVIELKEPFELSDNIRTIEIPAEDDEPPTEGEVCQISGWGSTQKMKKDDAGDGLVPSSHLRKADVTILSSDECKERYSEEFYSPEMLCAGDNEKDACHGDSGGPLICDDTLYGVISSGSGCGTAGYPGVYTNLVEYQEWIESFLPE